MFCCLLVVIIVWLGFCGLGWGVVCLQLYLIVVVFVLGVWLWLCGLYGRLVLGVGFGGV